MTSRIDDQVSKHSCYLAVVVQINRDAGVFTITQGHKVAKLTNFIELQSVMQADLELAVER